MENCYKDSTAELPLPSVGDKLFWLRCVQHGLWNEDGNKYQIIPVYVKGIHPAIDDPACIFVKLENPLANPEHSLIDAFVWPNYVGTKYFFTEQAARDYKKTIKGVLLNV